MSRCIGCGVKLQTSKPDEPGYVKEIVMIENGENVYCKRCHDIIHHNIKYDATLDLDNYYKKIKEIKYTKSLILLLIDVFDINNGLIPNLSNYIGNNEVLILVNKIDIMPKSVKLHNIEKYIKSISEKNNLNILGIMMISAKSTNDCIKVIEKIRKLKYRYKNKSKVAFNDCYAMGYSSVGKSTFINTVIANYLDNKNFITTSAEFNTTLDFIKIPLDSKSYLIDTPGIINKNSFGYYLTSDSMKDLVPKTYIKPRTFQLNIDQTIFIGGLCYLDFLEGENISASFYVSNDLYLHRTKTINKEKLLNLQKNKLLVPPYTSDESNLLSDMVKIDLNIDNKNEPKTLFIPNVGFVHLSGNDVLISLYIDKKIKVWFEDSVF